VVSVELLKECFPEQLWLEFSPEQQEAAWRQTDQQAGDAACWRGYLNRLAAMVLSDWFAHEDPSSAPLQPWPSQEEWPTIWQFVSGVPFTLGNIKLVMIVDEAITRRELEVPKEWVDIPEWAAQYYLAVQIDLEKQILGVRGWMDYEGLVTSASYHSFHHSYSVALEQLHTDLDLLWYQVERFAPAVLSIAPLAVPGSIELIALAQRLSIPLTLPLLAPSMRFEAWASLLVNPNWRRFLYQRQMGQQRWLSLSQCLQRKWTEIEEAGWQQLQPISMTRSFALRGSDGSDVEDFKLLCQEFGRIPHKAQALAQALETVDRLHPQNDVPDAAEYLLQAGKPSKLLNPPTQTVEQLLPLLDASQSEVTRLLAAKLLLRLDPHLQPPLHALVQLTQHTEEEDLRWHAFDILTKLPNPPTANGIQLVRPLEELGLRLAGDPLELSIALMECPGGSIAVRLRVHARGERSDLRVGVRLRLLNLLEQPLYFDGTEIPVEEVSIERTRCLQLKLNVDPGDSFIAEVRLGDARVHHYFTT
jgi:Protein of unknown function (DUF1822)